MWVLKKFHVSLTVMGSLSYILGAGIARYLGNKISLISFAMGWLIILSLLIAMFLFYENNLQTMLGIGGKISNQTKISNIQKIVIILFVFCVLNIMALLFAGEFNIFVSIIVLLTIFLLLLYVFPDLLNKYIAYNEIILSFLIGYTIPIFAFTLQGAEFNRLILFITIPLILFIIAFNFAWDFFSDNFLTTGIHTSLLDLFKWEHIIPLHTNLIFLAYLIFAILPLFGLSWKLIWPVFLAFPFSMVEIIWLHRIGDGSKPYWKIFSLYVPMTTGLIIYLLVVPFWVR